MREEMKARGLQARELGNSTTLGKHESPFCHDGQSEERWWEVKAKGRQGAVFRPIYVVFTWKALLTPCTSLCWRVL